MIILAVILSAGIIAAVCICNHQWIPATCTDPEICSKCGKTQADALGHDWLAATCSQPETCSVCGQTQGEALGHSGQPATCTDAAVCGTCGEILSEALGHNWLAATCSQPETCSICGETQGEALDHDWLAATCSQPETCGICSETQGEVLDHDWLAATCSQPETCSICSETQGEVLDHNWLAANCSQPETCSICGQTQGETTSHTWKNATCSDPKTCSVCGKTSGSALGHTWQEATCITAKTCSVCGKTSGSALGHQFQDNEDDSDKLCTICGRSVTTKYVALTFDDGPSGNLTLKLLAGLEERGVKSTFFVCGYRVKSYPDLPQIVLDYGHELALHTNTHANLTELSADEIEKELQKTIDLLPEGYHVTLMRPPGGNYNSTVKQVCKEMGLSIILWSLDTRDWATDDVDKVVNKIVNNVKDGDVILMHELKSSSIEAALKAIDILKNQGYEFVTVSQLAAIQEMQLEAGKVYTDLD